MATMLPAAFLRQLEAELCRSKHRSAWWTGAETDAGAVGRMTCRFLDCRNQTQWVRAKHGELSQTRLLEKLENVGHVLSSATLSNYLNGKANTGGNRDWYAVAPAMLRLVLQGTRDVAQGEQSKLVDRIVEFFFPKGFKPGNVEVDRNKAWYFHPKLKRLDMPATTEEAVAEIRAIAFYCGPEAATRGRATIVRTSGQKRFLQLDGRGQLTSSGLATLDALRAGVDVAFVFPDLVEPTDAERSARHFYRIAQRRLDPVALGHLQLAPVKPGDLRPGDAGATWGGEYLSRTLRYVYHRCEPDVAPGSATSGAHRWEPWSTLLVSRDPQWGPCAYQTDDQDVAAFEQWWVEFRAPSAGAATETAPLKIRPSPLNADGKPWDADPDGSPADAALPSERRVVGWQ